MRTPGPDMSRCMNLRKLITEKREKIFELEQIIEAVGAPASVFDWYGQPGIVSESQKARADAQNELDIAQREVEDLLNDFEFSECHLIL